MKVETYLQQGRMLDQRITYNLKKLSEIRNDLSSIRAPVISNSRVQTSPSGEAPFVRALMQVEELEEQIRQENDLLMKLRKQIHDVIDQVEREEQRLALMYKYLEGLSLEQIGERLHAGKTTIHRWIKMGIEQITLPENPIIVRYRR